MATGDRKTNHADKVSEACNPGISTVLYLTARLPGGTIPT